MAAAEELCESSVRTYTIEASVPTGFESVASDEAKEVFSTECRAMRGKITFQTPADRVKEILKLGGIDHCRAQILHVPNFAFTSDGDDCLTRLQLLVKECDWAQGLEVWKKFYTFDHPIPCRPDTIPTDEELIDICYSVHMPGHQSAGQSPKKKSRREKRKERKEKGYRQHREVNDKGKPMELDDRKDFKGKEGEMNGDVGTMMSDGAAAIPHISEGGSELTATHEMQTNDVTAVNGCTAEKASCGASNVSGAQDEQDSQSPVKKFKNHGDTECQSHGTARLGDMETSSATDAGKTPTSCRQAAGFSTDHTMSSAEDFNNITPTNGAGAISSQDVEDSTPTNSVTDTQSSVTPGQDLPSNSSPGKKSRKPRDPTKPAFRVTCKRTGEHHSFDSMSAAASFGSAIQTYFGWSVDMTKYDIEVMLTIDNDDISVGLTLTPESLHKRNLVAFGVTTLRPTICHNMLRMVKIFPGHVVCDPLCGTASISIQGALRFPALQLCGDNHRVAMEKTLCNKTAQDNKRKDKGSGALKMDAVHWNACHLPLRDGVVDVFVSDLPFGKRVGRKFDNYKLYCNVLDEMARCGKLSGRAALLTGDSNNMIKAIQSQKYWTRRRSYSCNIGGIAATVFLLFRCSIPYVPRSQRQAQQHPHPSHLSSQHNGPQPGPPTPCPDHSGTQPAMSGASQCNQNGPHHVPSTAACDQSEEHPIPPASSCNQNGEHGIPPSSSSGQNGAQPVVPDTSSHDGEAAQPVIPDTSSHDGEAAQPVIPDTSSHDGEAAQPMMPSVDDCEEPSVDQREENSTDGDD